MKLHLNNRVPGLKFCVLFKFFDRTTYIYRSSREIERQRQEIKAKNIENKKNPFLVSYKLYMKYRNVLQSEIPPPPQKKIVLMKNNF